MPEYDDGVFSMLALAAACAQNGGTLSLSMTELTAVDLSRFVGQPRLDGSGIDFYFREAETRRH